jgi:magnesium chelatase family protein
MLGSPGVGESMLARRLATMLPIVSLAEAIAAIRIHRIAGVTGWQTVYDTTRPCRAPPHTISDVGVRGGGQMPLPREVSLAPHGLLCLEALPAFTRHVLEVLRQPLDDGISTESPRWRLQLCHAGGVSRTGDGREGFGQRTVAACHLRDSHHA